MSASRFCRMKAFTIVELLVVIAILSALLALMLPALEKSREQARTVKCAANMRSIGLATQYYLNENNAAFPPYSNPTPRLAQYVDLAQTPSGAYVGSNDARFTKSVFYCPSAAGKPLISGDTDTVNRPYGGAFQGYNSYGFNCEMQGAPPSYPYWWSAAPRQIRLHEVSDPSRVFWAIDAYGFRVDRWYFFVAVNRHFLGGTINPASVNNLEAEDGQTTLYVDGHASFAKTPKDAGVASKVNWNWPFKWE